MKVEQVKNRIKEFRRLLNNKIFMGSFKDLLAYKKGFDLAMKIFEMSKLFPSEEKFNLTSQIRRSSRSVCANIAEAYRRRSSKNYFISKLNDVLSENTETEVWLDFSRSCEFIDQNQYADLKKANDEIGKLVSFMIKNPEKFGEQRNKIEENTDNGRSEE